MHSSKNFKKWYYEDWHKYHEKRSVIQQLYYDVLKWGTLRSGLNLLYGKGKVAIDVGVAHGYVIMVLNKLGYMAYGIDISKFYIYNYAKRVTNDLIICDAQALPFKQESFDLITAFELIEHLPMPLKFLSGCQRALKKGGSLLITTPNATFKVLDLKFWRDCILGKTWFGTSNIEGHEREFRMNIEVKRMFEDVGFNEVIVETWWFAPVPPKLFRRYLTSKVPLFVIPHFRCMALKG